MMTPIGKRNRDRERDPVLIVYRRRDDQGVDIEASGQAALVVAAAFVANLVSEQPELPPFIRAAAEVFAKSILEGAGIKAPTHVRIDPGRRGGGGNPS